MPTSFARFSALLGGFAVFAPLVVLGGWWATEHSHVGNSLNGYAGLFLAAFLYIGTPIGLGTGFVCGVMGVVLGKGSKALPFAGLVLNVAATLWVLHGVK